MGNSDLRRLLFVGATAALARIKSAKSKTALNQSPLADWARGLLAKKPFRLVAAALANKMARIAWAILAGDDCYNPKHMPASASGTAATQST
jgi:transposase